MNDSLEFNVDLHNFSGSLDALLDLAKSQKVDLEKISITKLADQFHEFIKSTNNINLEQASEYLLMATWLAYLKSKLLLPESEEEEPVGNDAEPSDSDKEVIEPKTQGHVT